MGKFINKDKINNSTFLSFAYRVYTKFWHTFMSDKKYMENAFKKYFNKDLDWKNPQTFQEKLQWLKLNDRTELHTQCADKVAVRNYVSDKIGSKYLIPQLQVLEDVNDLTPEKLPEPPFIIKCNHNCGGHTFVHDKSKINWSKERVKFNNILKQNYYYQSREWQYKNIPPRVIVEKLLLDENGNIPFDYKFYCFNGKAEAIHVSIKRDGVHYVIFFDLNWNVIPLKYREYSNEAKFDIPKPAKLKEMETLANTLSSDFPFARVDFYHNLNEIYFGEITFHPGSGLQYYMPERYNSDLGKLIDLN